MHGPGQFINRVMTDCASFHKQAGSPGGATEKSLVFDQSPSFLPSNRFLKFTHHNQQLIAQYNITFAGIADYRSTHDPDF